MCTPSVHQDKKHSLKITSGRAARGDLTFRPETLTNSQRAHAVFLSVVHPASSSRCGPPRAILPSVIPPRSSVPTASGLAYLPPVRTLGDKPGHENAHEAPENAHHDQRHSEAVVRHACTPADEPAGCLTLASPGSVNSGSRDLRTSVPPPALSVTRTSDSAPWTGAPPSPVPSQAAVSWSLSEVWCQSPGRQQGFLARI